ncbi:MAG: hypothetical protein AB1898_06720 [Acidobacteriota bacterium]
MRPTKSSRRTFLQTAAAGLSAAGIAMAQQTGGALRIEASESSDFRRQLAERELLRGIARLQPDREVRLSGRGERSHPTGLLFVLRTDPAQFQHPQAYRIRSEPGRVLLSGASEEALLYSVFEFLERQGAFFGIDGESYPLTRLEEWVLPPPGQAWESVPRLGVRGLLPWPDFLNCITVFNEEDFRAYFEAMLRMRFNTFGMHVYSGAYQWAESYLSLEYGGVGHLAFLDTTATHRWGYLPQRTSQFGMGGSRFYDGEVFGSDATRFARDPWEQAERTRQLLQSAYRHAKKLGLRIGIGFEPYQIPDEILRALPPEVRLERPAGQTGPRFDVESRTARDLLETRLAQLLEAYPEVDDVWLWEDESMNWASRKSGQPLSVTPFQQAHDFLKRHAPGKKLVLAGWGGVARHFEHFHETLPGNVIFSCLSDSLGWDPIHEVFGKLDGRERWPIPWLEDDPGMWLTQLHVHRFRQDVERAERYGCQGLLGIHWRHRIVDPTAGFLARSCWDSKLQPAEYYAAYARTQAVAARAPRLAELLDAADRDRKLLSTWTGRIENGHAVTQEFSGDYAEGFSFWNGAVPDPRVVESQEEVTAALRELTSDAASPNERERLGYLAGHLEFMVHYTNAWNLARQLHDVLKEAGELKTSAPTGEARSRVLAEGVPLWLKLAPEVRLAMLAFQKTVATRNDLGTLASLHNKLVRLALVRLRLSMKEYLGELPEETETLLADVLRPEANSLARLIVPTRPSLLLRGEKVRVMVVVDGQDAADQVTLHTRTRGERRWKRIPAGHLGRRTYEAWLGPFAAGPGLAEYFLSAILAGKEIYSPVQAPENTYLLTLL